MCDYVDYPKKIWTPFCCAVLYVCCVTHLIDSCDFLTHILLCCFAGGVGYTKYGILLTFSSQISNQKHSNFHWFFMWIDTNSQVRPLKQILGLIYQGSILNLGLNHMQYAVFISNQTKNMWFVPLIRNMNCAITYIYWHKNLSCLWQVHPWFKGKYIGADHPCVRLNVACPTNWQRSWQVFMGSLFNPLLNEFRNC